MLVFVNCRPLKHAEHSFPLDEPFYPYKVFGVLEVFNEALAFEHIYIYPFYCFS